jgi:hypothetical protein
MEDTNSETSSQIISLKGRTDLRGIQPNSGHGDYSRLSCGVGEAQLGLSAKISAGCLRGRWSIAEMAAILGRCRDDPAAAN